MRGLRAFSAKRKSLDIGESMALHTRKFNQKEILTLALLNLLETVFENKVGDISAVQDDDGNVVVYFSDDEESEPN